MGFFSSLAKIATPLALLAGPIGLGAGALSAGTAASQGITLGNIATAAKTIAPIATGISQVGSIFNPENASSPTSSYQESANPAATQIQPNAFVLPDFTKNIKAYATGTPSQGLSLQDLMGTGVIAGDTQSGVGGNPELIKATPSPTGPRISITPINPAPQQNNIMPDITEQQMNQVAGQYQSLLSNNKAPTTPAPNAIPGVKRVEPIDVAGTMAKYGLTTTPQQANQFDILGMHNIGDVVKTVARTYAIIQDTKRANMGLGRGALGQFLDYYDQSQKPAQEAQAKLVQANLDIRKTLVEKDLEQQIKPKEPFDTTIDVVGKDGKTYKYPYNNKTGVMGEKALGEKAATSPFFVGVGADAQGNPINVAINKNTKEVTPLNSRPSSKSGAAEQAKLDQIRSNAIKAYKKAIVDGTIDPSISQDEYVTDQVNTIHYGKPTTLGPTNAPFNPLHPVATSIGGQQRIGRLQSQSMNDDKTKRAEQALSDPSATQQQKTNALNYLKSVGKR